ncbi:MAG: rhomboid family intramembrane serine protease [Myxococcota bacterium]
MSGRDPSFALGNRRPGPALTAILILNVVCYVAELIAMRLGAPVEELFFMTPARVFGSGAVWQLFTYPLLHSPTEVSHIAFNMLTLYLFGGPLERWWGTRRFVTGYVLFALAGGLFTLLVALLSLTPVLSWLVPHLWTTPTVGASGAGMGLLIGFGFEFAEQRLAFPPMKVRTFVWVMIGFELLVALSFAQISSTSHFGGMLGALLFMRGPGKWFDGKKRAQLEKKKRLIESELRVIQGGKGGGGDLPN